MGTVDRGLIIAAGSQCPDDSNRLPSIAGLTDIAITRVSPSQVWRARRRLSYRRQSAEVLLARHQRPADARELVGERHGGHLARLGGPQLGEPGVLLGALAVDERRRAIDQQPAQVAVAALADRA